MPVHVTSFCWLLLAGLTLFRCRHKKNCRVTSIFMDFVQNCWFWLYFVTWSKISQGTCCHPECVNVNIFLEHYLVYVSFFSTNPTKINYVFNGNNTICKFIYIFILFPNSSFVLFLSLFFWLYEYPAGSPDWRFTAFLKNAEISNCPKSFIICRKHNSMFLKWWHYIKKHSFFARTHFVSIYLPRRETKLF